jgi:hypothetical protein
MDAYASMTPALYEFDETLVSTDRLRIYLTRKLPGRHCPEVPCDELWRECALDEERQDVVEGKPRRIRGRPA